jgi:hypothetical protein
MTQLLESEAGVGHAQLQICFHLITATAAGVELQLSKLDTFLSAEQCCVLCVAAGCPV